MGKFTYSLIWLILLLYAFGVILKHEGPWWDIAYALVFVAIIIQTCLVCYNASDTLMRKRMWDRLRGRPTFCEHVFMDTDNCPDCRH